MRPTATVWQTCEVVDILGLIVESGWRIDLPGAQHVLARGSADVEELRSILGAGVAMLEDAVFGVDPRVAAALGAYAARYTEVCELLNRRATVVDGGRMVLEEYRAADAAMAEEISGAQLIADRFSERVAP